jgi:hypothetical protein
MCSLLHPKLHWLYGYLRLGQASKPLPHCNLLMLSKLMCFPQTSATRHPLCDFPCLNPLQLWWSIPGEELVLYNPVLHILFLKPAAAAICTAISQNLCNRRRKVGSCLHVLTLSINPGTPKQRKMMGLNVFSSDSYTWVYSPIAHEFCKPIWKLDGWIPRETTVHNFFMRNIPPPSTHQRKMKQTRKNSSEIDEANLPRHRTKMCWRIPSGLIDGSLVPHGIFFISSSTACTHARCLLLIQSDEVRRSTLQGTFTRVERKMGEPLLEILLCRVMPSATGITGIRAPVR